MCGAGWATSRKLANVFDDMSVQENLEMGGYTRKGGLRARIAQVLKLFPDLGADRHKKASAMSGGQQRMLAGCAAGNACRNGVPRAARPRQPSTQRGTRPP